jgi:hypothetical protein
MIFVDFQLLEKFRQCSCLWKSPRESIKDESGGRPRQLKFFTHKTDHDLVRDETSRLHDGFRLPPQRGTFGNRTAKKIPGATRRM